MPSRLATPSVAFVCLAPFAGPDVGYFKRDDQMMLGVDGDLDIVAHNA
jgi:hypothetical protein